MTKTTDCPLCATTGGELLWSNALLRVINVDDPMHPGFTRVVWQKHIAEMTQLSATARQALMDAVWRVEQAQRDILRPDKINLAQFGNMVPHLHWHVIPRWTGDSHFPEAVWAPAPNRSAEQVAAWSAHKATIQARLPQYHTAVVAALNDIVAS